MAILKTLGAWILLMVIACGQGPSSSDELGPGPAVSGVYEVSGTTVDVASGGSRPIRGHVNLQIQGDRYTTHFELETTDPATGTSAASVVGTGDGQVEGSTLRGTAEVQLVTGTAPGVDVGFAFVPREVGQRIASTATAEFLSDGSVRIEIENVGVGESEYGATKTALVGQLKEAPEDR